MKRLLLLGLSFGIAATSMAQDYGQIIGQTYYDLHSNSSTGNRLIMNADGSMSATWIEHWDFLDASNQPKPGVRGFGYNNFTPSTNGWAYGETGECFGDNFGCASQYVGWPEMINLSAANGAGKQEFVINHTPLKMTTRAAIGTGAWGNTLALGIDLSESSDGGTWPRAVSSGNYVHAIAVLAGPDQDYTDVHGVQIPLRYYRSSDGGVNWDIQDGDVFDLEAQFDVTVDSIFATDSVASIDTSEVITTDSMWMDTVFNGTFTLFGGMFDADMLGLDTTIYASSDTVMANMVKDTTVSIMTDSAAGDTFAVRSWTAYNTEIVYDTTFVMDTMPVIETVDGLHVDAVGGDAYNIAVNGSTVAVTLGGSGLDRDWMLYVSNDNGTTWTKRLVKSNHYDGVPDFIVETVDGPANSYLINMDNFEVIVEDDGTVHVFCGSDIYTDQGDGGYFTGSDLYKEVEAGMFYWNTDMADNTAKIVGKPDFGLDGDDAAYTANTSEYYGFWTLGWPAASYDNNGGIYLLYSAVAENQGADYITPAGDTIGYYDILMTYSLDGGTTWCRTEDPINVAEDVFGMIGSTPTEDDLFPVSVPEVDASGNIHFTWQKDYSRPGLALIDDSHPNDQLNYIMYAKMDVSGLASCTDVPVLSVSSKLANSFKFNLVPNPAKDMVTISAEDNISNIELVNMFGQTVRNINANNNNTQNVIVSDLAEGVYVVKVTTAKGIATEKLTITK